MKRKGRVVAAFISLIIVGFLLDFSAKAQENPYALQTQVIQNQQQIKVLQQQQAQLYLKIDNLLVKYGEIKGELDSIMHQLDNLQQQINQLTMQQQSKSTKQESLTTSPLSQNTRPQSSNSQNPTTSTSNQTTAAPTSTVTSSQTNTNNVASKQQQVSKPISEDKKLLDESISLFKEKKYDQAIAKLKAFRNKYKDSNLMADAVFYLAECYYNKGEFDKAIINYDYLVNSYPKNPKVPEATLKEGISFIKMGDKVDGNYLLQKVIKNYPNSKEAQLAEKLLKKGT